MVSERCSGVAQSEITMVENNKKFDSAWEEKIESLVNRLKKLMDQKREESFILPQEIELSATATSAAYTVEPYSYTGSAYADGESSSNYGQYNEGYNNGGAADQSAHTLEQSYSRYWGSQYPRWTYDPSTGQWYQLDGNDAGESVQANVQLNASSTWGTADGQTEFSYLQENRGDERDQYSSFGDSDNGGYGSGNQYPSEDGSFGDGDNAVQGGSGFGFGGNLFSSTPSLSTSNLMGIGQTTLSLTTPFQTTQTAQNSGAFGFSNSGQSQLALESGFDTPGLLTGSTSGSVFNRLELSQQQGMNYFIPPKSVDPNNKPLEGSFDLGWDSGINDRGRGMYGEGDGDVRRSGASSNGRLHELHDYGGRRWDVGGTDWDGDYDEKSGNASAKMTKAYSEIVNANNCSEDPSEVPQLSSNTKRSDGRNVADNVLQTVLESTIFENAEVSGGSLRLFVPNIRRKRSSLTTLPNSSHVADNVTTTTSTDPVCQLENDNVDCLTEKQINERNMKVTESNENDKIRAKQTTLKVLLGEAFEYGPALSEHIILDAGLIPSTKVRKDFKLDDNTTEALDKAVMRFEDWLAIVISGQKVSEGYIVMQQKNSGKQNDSSSQKIYDEFCPLLLNQFKSRDSIEFETFDAALELDPNNDSVKENELGLVRMVFDPGGSFMARWNSFNSLVLKLTWMEWIALIFVSN